MKAKIKNWTKSNTKVIKKILIGGVILFFFIFFIFSLYFLAVRFFYPEILDRGLFGDMFGGLNTVFSGLAFLGVIYAIILQKEELGLQRKELVLTRKELKRTAKAQEKSEQALSKQAASLKATAKLNGLSAILRHYGSLMETIGMSKYGASGIDPSLKEKAEEIKRQIEDTIAGK